MQNIGQPPQPPEQTSRVSTLRSCARNSFQGREWVKLVMNIQAAEKPTRAKKDTVNLATWSPCEVVSTPSPPPKLPGPEGKRGTLHIVAKSKKT